MFEDEILRKTQRGKAYADANSSLINESLINKGMVISNRLQEEKRKQYGGNLPPEWEDWCVQEAGREVPGFLEALEIWANAFQIGLNAGLDDPTLK